MEIDGALKIWVIEHNPRRDALIRDVVLSQCLVSTAGSGLHLMIGLEVGILRDC